MLIIVDKKMPEEAKQKLGLYGELLELQHPVLFIRQYPGILIFFSVKLKMGLLQHLVFLMNILIL